MVFLKIGILAFFCVVAFTAFDGSNLVPFAPLGIVGIQAAAGQVFFSYIGFDAASTAGEEAKNPRRDLPIAILSACSSSRSSTCWSRWPRSVRRAARPSRSTAATTSGATATARPCSRRSSRDVTGSSWAPALISLGAVISIFSVVLTVMYGQTRILFAMGRDGLLPQGLHEGQPAHADAGHQHDHRHGGDLRARRFVPLGQLAEATSIGTLFAFLLVNIGVIVLRRTRPDLKRSFMAPFFPITPILGMLFCGYLLVGLAGITWLVFGLWLLVRPRRLLPLRLPPLAAPHPALTAEGPRDVRAEALGRCGWSVERQGRVSVMAARAVSAPAVVEEWGGGGGV